MVNMFDTVNCAQRNFLMTGLKSHTLQNQSIIMCAYLRTKVRRFYYN